MFLFLAVFYFISLTHSYFEIRIYSRLRTVKLQEKENFLLCLFLMHRKTTIIECIKMKPYVEKNAMEVYFVELLHNRKLVSHTHTQRKLWFLVVDLPNITGLLGKSPIHTTIKILYRSRGSQVIEAFPTDMKFHVQSGAVPWLF